MKVQAEYHAGEGHVLLVDGEQVWSDTTARYAPEDCTVTRSVGDLLTALGVEIEYTTRCVDCGLDFDRDDLDDGQCEDCWDVAVEADPTLHIQRMR